MIGEQHDGDDGDDVDDADDGEPPGLLHRLLPTFQQLFKAANPFLQQLLWQA